VNPVLCLLQASAELPAEPPIGGPLWTIVIPAVLLCVASLGTFLLYRHFAGKDETESS
jgi:hypothetical protein